MGSSRWLTAMVMVMATTAAAEEPPCRPDGLLLFPAPGAVVPANVQWILEGLGAEQTRVSDLVGTQALSLLADDGTSIALKVERGWVSQAKRVAVRLKAATALARDTRYTLTASSALAGAVFLNAPLGTARPSWTTSSGADRDIPRYRSKPAVAEGWYSAGPQETLVRKLRLRVAVDEKAPAYFLVSMQRMRGSAVRQQYPVPLEGDSIIIGHDACGGSFGFEDGRAYRLGFELFDSSGNRNAERVSLEISAPRPPR